MFHIQWSTGGLLRQKTMVVACFGNFQTLLLAICTSATTTRSVAEAVMYLAAARRRKGDLQ
jgi:hypothetical protein